jgi:diaminopimelate epimerase
MGNPHIVFPVADINQAPLTTLGPGSSFLVRRGSPISTATSRTIPLSSVMSAFTRPERPLFLEKRSFPEQPYQWETPILFFRLRISIKRLFRTGACSASLCNAGAAFPYAEMKFIGADGFHKFDILAGGDLVINWQDNGHVLMTGPAETVCSGVYYL